MKHSAELGRTPARQWLPVLRTYRDPNVIRSMWEIGVSIGIFIVGWIIAWITLSQNMYWASGLAVLLVGMMLMRLFALMHDCGHGTLFTSRAANRWAGRVLGVFCLSPAALWSKKHEIHHATHGNLDERGVGDIRLLTVDEYTSKSAFQQLSYRIYRNPYFLLGFGPFYTFFIEYRLPFRLMKQRRYWQSAMGANIAIGLLLFGIYLVGGYPPLLFIFVPSVLIGGFAGVWVFYVQHQFDGIEWQKDVDWDVHDAALYGSSYLVLPTWLNWFTCNIGIHHVHHLYSRIPFYRLPEVLADHPELAQTNRLTLRESVQCLKLSLWDEKTHRLIPFSEV